MTRKEYIEHLNYKEAAAYVCKMYKDNRYKISKALVDEQEMKQWLMATVDEKGREIM